MKFVWHCDLANPKRRCRSMQIQNFNLGKFYQKQRRDIFLFTNKKEDMKNEFNQTTSLQEDQ